MGIRDPPRRFPIPIPAHEARWGAYRLDAIYGDITQVLSDMFGKIYPLANAENPTNLSLATQTLEINNTV